MDKPPASVIFDLAMLFCAIAGVSAQAGIGWGLTALAALLFVKE